MKLNITLLNLEMWSDGHYTCKMYQGESGGWHWSVSTPNQSRSGDARSKQAARRAIRKEIVSRKDYEARRRIE